VGSAARRLCPAFLRYFPYPSPLFPCSFLGNVFPFFQATFNPTGCTGTGIRFTQRPSNTAVNGSPRSPQIVLRFRYFLRSSVLLLSVSFFDESGSSTVGLSVFFQILVSVPFGLVSPPFFLSWCFFVQVIFLETTFFP